MNKIKEEAIRGDCRFKITSNEYENIYGAIMETIHNADKAFEIMVNNFVMQELDKPEWLKEVESLIETANASHFHQEANEYLRKAIELQSQHIRELEEAKNGRQENKD